MVDEKGRPLAPDDHPSMLALCTGRPRLNVMIGIDEPNGRRRWVSTNSQPVRIPGTSQVQGVVCSFNDITHQREADLQLLYQATHDPLTGLSNREVVVGQLQRRLDRNSGEKSTVGLLFIDLDRFKAVNDTLGHVGGVELYDESLGARIRHRTDLQNELRLALDHGDITVRYQPIADLVTQRLVGVEALARWKHPVHGWIPPEDFVAVAERSGLILPL